MANPKGIMHCLQQENRLLPFESVREACQVRVCERGLPSAQEEITKTHEHARKHTHTRTKTHAFLISPPATIVVEAHTLEAMAAHLFVYMCLCVICVCVFVCVRMLSACVCACVRARVCRVCIALCECVVAGMFFM